MKIGGLPSNGPKRSVLVLPRNGVDFVFHFVAVTDDAEFDKMYPEPEAPVTFNVKLQEHIKQLKDPAFIKKIVERNKAHNGWIFLKSIEPSNIEWDLVDMTKPETWHRWREDFEKAGFSINEVNRIYEAFAEANLVSQDMLDEARKRFLASQAAGPSVPQ